MWQLIKQLFQRGEACSGGEQAPNDSVKPDTGSSKSQPDLTLAFDGHTNLYRNGTVSLGVTFSSTGSAKIDDLAIDIHGKRFPALEWKPFNVVDSTNQPYKFNLAELVKTAGEEPLKELRLAATIGGKYYYSLPFDISGLIL
jgi:hypothetical protein